MNKFEEFINEVIDFLKKFFKTVYTLIFKPILIADSLIIWKDNIYIKPVNFFFISEFIGLLILKSMPGNDSLKSLTGAIPESINSSSLLSLSLLLIPSYLIIQTAILILNRIFKSEVKDQHFFRQAAFYYAGIGMLISISLIAASHYLQPYFSNNAAVDNYLENNDWDFIKSWSKEIGAKIKNQYLGEVKFYQQNQFWNYLQTGLDNLLCIIIPMGFIWSYQRKYRKNRIKNYFLIAFCFFSYILCQNIVKLFYQEFFNNRGSFETSLFGDDGITRLGVEFVKIDSSYEGKIKFNFTLQNKSTNKIYLYNKIHIMIAGYQVIDSLKKYPANPVFYDLLLEGKNEKAILLMNPGEIKSYELVTQGPFDLISALPESKEMTNASMDFKSVIQLECLDEWQTTKILNLVPISVTVDYQNVEVK